MANEEEANLAREQYSDDLTGMGAHAIGVDEISIKGEKTFAVIMYLEKLKEQMPKFLTIHNGEKDVKVPLKIQVSETFKPEQ